MSLISLERFAAFAEVYSSEETEYFRSVSLIRIGPDKKAFWRLLSGAITKYWSIPLPTLAAFISQALLISVFLFTLLYCIIASILYFSVPTSMVSSDTCYKVSCAVFIGYPVLCICVNREKLLLLVRSLLGDVVLMIFQVNKMATGTLQSFHLCCYKEEGIC